MATSRALIVLAALLGRSANLKLFISPLSNPTELTIFVLVIPIFLAFCIILRLNSSVPSPVAVASATVAPSADFTRAALINVRTE